MKIVKNTVLVIFIICFILGLVGAIFKLQKKIEDESYPIPIVNGIVLKDDVVTVSYENNKESKHNTMYYIYKTSNAIPSIEDKEWKETQNNEFSFKIDDNIYYAFLKNGKNDIFEVDGIPEVGRIKDLTTNKSKLYFAPGDSFKLVVNYKSIGNTDNNMTFVSDNDSIATVNKDGLITAKKAGNTKIHVKIDTEDKAVDVIVTNLITKKPKTFNNSKPYVPCGKHSEKDNDLLDEILKDRIASVGYKTRAGAVEAARFLALEFPYRIRYFSENGRLSTNNVDAEGRYYHYGLFLHKSRYNKLLRSSSGPQTWGCKLYSGPAHGQRANGLDCSGFISWVLLNGGFDVKDVGAGLSSSLDLTDYGNRTVVTKSVVSSGKIRVGDLLSNGGTGGGHIAIIVGEDEKNYYVAESLWTYPTIGVVISTYTKNNFHNNWNYVMLMDSYYKSDGLLKKMWY